MTPLWTSGEVCAYCGFTRTTLKYHRRRTLPKPVKDLGARGALWEPAAIKQWWKLRQSADPRILQVHTILHLNGGNVSDAARRMNLDRATIRRLRAIGQREIGEIR